MLYLQDLDDCFLNVSRRIFGYIIPAKETDRNGWEGASI